MKKRRPTRLLTPRQVGEQLNFSPRTITRWCREGRFKEAIKVGRVWRIPEGSFDGFDQL
jgi:excisionase family DNA binding protein